MSGKVSNDVIGLKQFLAPLQWTNDPLRHQGATPPPTFRRKIQLFTKFVSFQVSPSHSYVIMTYLGNLRGCFVRHGDENKVLEGGAVASLKKMCG